MIDFDKHWTILISLQPLLSPKYLCSLLEKQLNFGLYHYNISLNVTAIIPRAVNFFFLNRILIASPFFSSIYP